MQETTKQPKRKVRLGVVGGGPGSNIGEAHRSLAAFANLYSDIADAVLARRDGVEVDPLAYLFPTVVDGVLGVMFIDAAVASHQQDGRWVHASIDIR